MTQQHPKDTLQADLEALAEVFEAEEREDRRIEAQRRRDGLPEPGFAGFVRHRLSVSSDTAGAGFVLVM